jgi:glycosyltransferase involved in cell wall biosynthesis
MKVAYYSPLPPSRSGVADYSALLLPALERHVDVVVARPRRLRRAPKADIAIYHVGNDPEAHGWIVEALRRRPADRPGVVVLHELVLHHLVAGTTLARGDAAGYLDALEREHGLPGRLLGYAVLDNRIPPLWETRPEEFPLAGTVLRAAAALVVHSRYVETGARNRGFSGPVFRIPHPAWPVPPHERASIEGSPLVGCFGNLNASKRVAQLLSAFARLRERRPGARLLLVGAPAPRFDLDAIVARRVDLGSAVLREAYVDEQRLWSLMAACDVCVNLRDPTMGETSGTAVRALSLGKPLVVSDVGWFAELPDAVAIKVPVDEHEPTKLAAALELLTDDPALRESMTSASRRLAETEHALDRVAELYAAALEQAAGGAKVREAVLREVATAAAEVGIGRDDRETAEIGRRLSEVGLGE